MGFTREQLAAYHGATVPDLVGPGVRLLFVGINPGLWTAATQTHFAHPSNRFYPALERAGLIGWTIDPSAGMSDDDRSRLIELGIGITNIVNRATARAAELGTAELREGADALAARIKRWEPRVVAIAGITAYRTAFRRPRAHMGEQPEAIGTSALWVVPNPSGLNAHETTDSLADWYRRAGGAAGTV